MSAQVWKELPDQKDMVITSNGRPIAILSSISENSLDQVLSAYRQARAMRAVAFNQEDSVRKGGRIVSAGKRSTGKSKHFAPSGINNKLWLFLEGSFYADRKPILRFAQPETPKNRRSDFLMKQETRPISQKIPPWSKNRISIWVHRSVSSLNFEF